MFSGVEIESFISSLKSYSFLNKLNNLNVIALKIEQYNSSIFIHQVPEDFKIFDYYLINDDVLNAEIDPYEHYLKFGQHEERIYSIDKLNNLAAYLDSYQNSKFKKLIPKIIIPAEFIESNLKDINFDLDPYEQIYKYSKAFPIINSYEKVKKRGVG
jgi:hypothetical protein